LTPQQRTLRARAAAHAQWAGEADRAGRLQAARNGFLAKFAVQVDPDGTLPADERIRRAEQARRSFMLSISLKSSRVRAARKAAADAAS